MKIIFEEVVTATLAGIAGGFIRWHWDLQRGERFSFWFFAGDTLANAILGVCVYWVARDLTTVTESMAVAFAVVSGIIGSRITSLIRVYVKRKVYKEDDTHDPNSSLP